MTITRKVEVFSADCPACDEVIALVKRLACPSCSVDVRNMKDIEVAKRAKELGIHSVPAVVIDGQLASCCIGGAIDEQALLAAGLGQA